VIKDKKYKIGFGGERRLEKLPLEDQEIDGRIFLSNNSSTAKLI
jgi:hypothetical protein